jgi:serine phosphatase RsbU (regulator of sigma subunit)
MRETGFDKQRFCEIVEANLDLGAQPLVDKIIAEVSPHQMSIRSPDDIALLVFRRGTG